MKKVFLDSSILVAACASKKGGSAFILGYCKQKKLKGYVSFDVIAEARRNVELKLNQVGKNRFSHFIKFANLFIVPPPNVEKIAECEQYIYAKDAPILAAAMESPAAILITLDRKHFLKEKVIQYFKPKVITTAGDYVRDYLMK